MQFLRMAEIIRRADRISEVCSGSFMTSSALALGILNLAGLRLLFTIGSGAGFALILLGLLLNRTVRHSSQESHLESAGAGSAHESSPTESCAPQPIIQLSADPGPSQSSDMSQQQKIAAALTRAGVANSAGWSTPPPSRAATAVMDPPAGTPTAGDRTPDSITRSAHSTWTHKLILLAGSALLLVSLILFFTIR